MKRLAGAAKPRSWKRMKLTIYPYGGLGSNSFGCGTIHAAGRPSSFAASWPAVTSSLRESLVAVERGHGSGSMMMMG
jgi:hypothetical protein